MLELMFSSAGLTVRAFASGEEAIAAVGEFVPDVVVTDITLPGASGVELIRRLREHPRRRALRAFALTGRSSLDGRDGADDAFDRVFVKPADFDALLKAVTAA
jgi:CheY-like chemotaxis protein